jgi:hypothetical protein
LQFIHIHSFRKKETFMSDQHPNADAVAAALATLMSASGTSLAVVSQQTNFSGQFTVTVALQNDQATVAIGTMTLLLSGDLVGTLTGQAPVLHLPNITLARETFYGVKQVGSLDALFRADFEQKTVVAQLTAVISDVTYQFTGVVASWANAVPAAQVPQNLQIAGVA